MSGVSRLQRRRTTAVTPLDADAPLDEDTDGAVRTARGASGTRPGGAQRTGGHDGADADLRPGGRVAYDPRDLCDERENRRHPRLTLMEEILLLGLKDRQGYLSFWNDNISYVLRGCLLMELAFRGRIGVLRGAAQKRVVVSERCIEVLSTKPTGEPMLDEALRILASNPPAGIGDWIDMLSAGTWNVMKHNVQMKQLRERLAKGLVDKGVLRTEKRNFLLFDMPTHPVADPSLKNALLRRLYALVTSPSPTVRPESLYAEEGADGADTALRVTRTLCMLCSAYCADVLEDCLAHLPYAQREVALQYAADLLEDFGQWPMAPDTNIPIPPRADASMRPPVGLVRRLSGKSRHAAAGAGAEELARAMQAEVDDMDLASFELVAGVLNVFSGADTL
ncbi:hypothetical protein MSPP1_003391 [Malassezia sp. CBS 17886]|nr:hypothetical protein MSPP1_003391 [Malassezia sp. CBS 17886]